MTTKFEVGKKYNSENGVKTYTVLRRTEKTVWMETEDNKTIQKRIKVTNFGNEKITDNFLETTSDCETLEPVMEPQDVAEPSNEPTITMTTIERQALIESFNHYATSLHSLDYGSQEYDEIWEKMMSIHDKIKNLETLETTPNEVPQDALETT